MFFEQRVMQTKLNEREKEIASFILEKKEEIAQMTTRDLAVATYTSASAIVRFSKKLSYKGFEELKEDYLAELNYINEHFKDIDPNQPFTKNHSMMEIVGIMTNLMRESALDTCELITHDALQKSFENH